MSIIKNLFLSALASASVLGIAHPSYAVTYTLDAGNQNTGATNGFFRSNTGNVVSVGIAGSTIDSQNFASGKGFGNFFVTNSNSGHYALFGTTDAAGRTAETGNKFQGSSAIFSNNDYTFSVNEISNGISINSTYAVGGLIEQTPASGGSTGPALSVILQDQDAGPDVILGKITSGSTGNAIFNTNSPVAGVLDPADTYKIGFLWTENRTSDPSDAAGVSIVTVDTNNNAPVPFEFQPELGLVVVGAFWGASLLKQSRKKASSKE